MKFSLELSLDNDAFAENPGYEVARILNRLGNRLVEYPDLFVPSIHSKGTLHDVNGAHAGRWEVSE
tara:strand:- start:1154 stop:1351 length:198 start_codon:yes stop_codon:yes gene_type:complete